VPEAAVTSAGGLHAANLTLRFLLELASLAALAYWGFHTGHSAAGDILLGVGVPVLAACVWGVWAAPRSDRRLSGPALTALQLTVLGAGAVALIAAGRVILGVVMAIVVVVNAVLLRRAGEH
jgi:hypothetical protein